MPFYIQHAYKVQKQPLIFEVVLYEDTMNVKLNTTTFLSQALVTITESVAQSYSLRSVATSLSLSHSLPPTLPQET